MKTNDKQIISHITRWLLNYSNKYKKDGFVIGISGGIDSAVTSTLCAMTGKPTFCISLPINQEKNQLNRAEEHINYLKNKFPNASSYNIDLTNTYKVFLKSITKILGKEDAISNVNLKPRIRMSTLYYISSIKNSLVVGTGNKIEDFEIGFFTKYGDGGVDISPIADLLKSEIYSLARELNINENILNAPPSDGLWDDNRTDEDQIGINYAQIEKVINDKNSPNNNKNNAFNIYKNLKLKNKHKMTPIPVCKIPKKKF